MTADGTRADLATFGHGGFATDYEARIEGKTALLNGCLLTENVGEALPGASTVPLEPGMTMAPPAGMTLCEAR